MWLVVSSRGRLGAPSLLKPLFWFCSIPKCKLNHTTFPIEEKRESASALGTKSGKGTGEKLCPVCGLMGRILVHSCHWPNLFWKLGMASLLS